MVEPVAERLRQCVPSRTSCEEAASIIERAYGLLWRDTTSRSPQAQEARRLLLAAISKDGRRRGISYAYARFGPVTDDEALRDFP